MSNAKNDLYEVFALRYATQRDRLRGENFITTDMHEMAMPIDYFVWAIRNADRTIVVDTGFDAAEAAARGRALLHTPRDLLAQIGVDASTVEHVVITHLHYDHAGTVSDFPSATFHLQDAEMQYATGRHMREAPLRHAYSVQHITNMVEQVFAGRVQFHDGDDELAPGISLHHIGGHTMGLQCVSVATARGTVVLAADAAHFYENMDTPSPFPIVYSVADMLAGFHTMRRIASSPNHVIPGHDPQVLTRYPAATPALAGTAVRVDLPPNAASTVASNANTN